MKSFLLLALLLPALVQAKELRLLTWNVFMIPRPINFSQQKERTRIIAEKLQDAPYDVILMQEAFIGSFRQRAGSALRKNFPFQHHLQRSVRPWHILNSGLFVLSRHPFEVLDHWYFTRCTHSDCLSAKGIILIEVMLPDNNKVQIAMTHTQAWDDQKAQKVRAIQFGQIKDLLDLHATPGVPQVLAGDFNIDGRMEHEYPHLLGLLDMKARPLDGELTYTNGFKVGCYKTPGDSPKQWLDHVWLDPRGTDAEIINNFVRPMTGTLGGKECSLSDHYAVEARIKL